MMAINRSAGETKAALRCEQKTGETTRMSVCHHCIMRCAIAPPVEKNDREKVPVITIRCDANLLRSI